MTAKQLQYYVTPSKMLREGCYSTCFIQWCKHAIILLIAAPQRWRTRGEAVMCEHVR